MDGKINQTGAIYTNIYGALVDATILIYYTTEWCWISTWVNTVASLLSVVGPVNAWRRCSKKSNKVCAVYVRATSEQGIWWWNVRVEGAWMTETTIRMKVKRRDCVAPGAGARSISKTRRYCPLAVTPAPLVLDVYNGRTLPSPLPSWIYPDSSPRHGHDPSISPTVIINRSRDKTQQLPRDLPPIFTPSFTTLPFTDDLTHDRTTKTVTSPNNTPRETA